MLPFQLDAQLQIELEIAHYLNKINIRNLVRTANKPSWVPVGMGAKPGWKPKKLLVGGDIR
jgi:hypothetical protein